MLLQAFAACGSESSDPAAEGQAGTDPQGQGSTDPKGQGGTDPQGQGLDRQTQGLAVGNLTHSYWPAACTLKSYDELDACVAAGTTPSLSADEPICASLSDWTENCEIWQNPECPGRITRLLDPRQPSR